MPKRNAGPPPWLPTPKTLPEFVALLDQCKTQVEDDPSGYMANPHLYDTLHRVYLRLCHGNVPDAERTRGAP